ncbi:hypothetical protein N7475_009452 [Penicillium sp. IBT 31633x]|nr:hypothetical protein N7475_009452 [Penicillium sp. IBT 31633x]
MRSRERLLSSELSFTFSPPLALTHTFYSHAFVLVNQLGMPTCHQLPIQNSAVGLLLALSII